MSAPKPVEDVAGESDFNSLTQWLMANTKDKEVREESPLLIGRARGDAHLAS